MNKSVLAAAAALAIAGGAMTIPASAADLDFLPPPPMPAPLAPTWTGFYIGGHVGYGEAKVNTRTDADIFLDGGALDDFGFFSSTLKPNGLVGGAQAGYNWQAGSLVFGIEGDISFTDWSKSTTVFDTDAGDLGGPDLDSFAFGRVSADVDFLASVRGRLGFAFDNLMIYGTGGVAWADAKARARVVAYDFGTDAEGVLSGSKSLNDFGFVVGGGAAWMVIPQTFSLGVEGLFYFFDKQKTLIDATHVFVGGDFADARVTAKLEDAWVVRLRGDFHF
jgi:outer membrane immunogenic protein